MSACHDCNSLGNCLPAAALERWVSCSLDALALAALALLRSRSPTQAQSLNDLSGVLGGGKGGAAGGLPSLDQASPSNIAGVLQYCVKNNYQVAATKRRAASLVGKLTGSGSGTKDSGFKAAIMDFWRPVTVKTFGLGGSGLQAKNTVRSATWY